MVVCYFYSMKIKIAFVNDISKIIEIAEATWKDTYAPFVSSEQIDYMYEQMYTTASILQQMQDGHTFLIYSEGDEPLGFISYLIREDGVLYIPKFYIKPYLQRKGIGKKLLEAVENIAVKNKISYLELNVNRKNSAMYFYKKMGFQLYEKADIAYGKFWLNDYILRKKMEQ